MHLRSAVLGCSLLGIACGPSAGVQTQESDTTTTAASTTEAQSTAISGSGADDVSEAGASGTTGPALEPACFPESGHGELLLEHASGLRVYASCSDLAEYFIEHPGEELVATIEDVNAVRDASVSGLFAVPGFASVGTGLCCDQPCISLTVQAYDLSLEALLAVLAQEFPEAEGQCFGIDVRLIGNDAPRCEQDDPECLPLPICGGFQDDGLCCDAPEYDPEASRVPVGDDFSGGDCTYDGECVLRGAGNYCMSWDSPGGPGLLICYPELSQAFCGCVDGGCHWFELG